MSKQLNNQDTHNDAIKKAKSSQISADKMKKAEMDINLESENSFIEQLKAPFSWSTFMENIFKNDIEQILKDVNLKLLPIEDGQTMQEAVLVKYMKLITLFCCLENRTE